jgi:hypothetical protein
VDRVHYVPDDALRAAGFCDLNSKTVQKKFTAWERALFWAWRERPDWAHAWFLEDDVFWAEPRALIRLVRAYDTDPSTGPDYIASKIGASKADAPAWPHWGAAYGLPFAPEHLAAAFTVVCRFSRALLEDVGKYARKYGTLAYLELFLPSLAKARGRRIHWFGPEAPFLHLRYRPAFTDRELNDALTGSAARVFHPVKHEPRLRY